MEKWVQIIMEWINCLELLGVNAKGIEDVEFYKKLIHMSWKDSQNKNITDNRDIIKEFIRDEYPDYVYNNESKLDENEQIYFASLFLLYTSQKPLFQQPMCLKLQHETQIRIKTFLEIILPYGKNITREILRTAITKLQDTEPSTPKTPKTVSLKEFFNSPAARTAQDHKIFIERNREIRKLKNELEVERFEKADLMEDLKLQQNKIQNLHKKLEEKAAEIKALKQEQMRPLTPQSCRKDKGRFQEQYYKKEVDRLEGQLLNKHCEMEKLEMDNSSLSKKLAYAQKQYSELREKCENYEKCLENLQVQGEAKDRELVNLRVANEELHTYVKEICKSSFGDQSFEVDEVTPPLPVFSPISNSEPLSAVIDIQLQEAKNESALLKAQLNVLNKKLESVTEEYNKIRQINIELQEKASKLEDTQKDLNNALTKLSCADETVESLLNEKVLLEQKITNLEELCISHTNSNRELQQKQEQNSIEISSLQENIIKHVKTIAELKSTANKYCEQIKTNLVETSELKDTIQKNTVTIDELTLTLNEYSKKIELCQNIEIEKQHLKETIYKQNNEVTKKQELFESLTARYVELQKNYDNLIIEMQFRKDEFKEQELQFQNKLKNVEKEMKFMTDTNTVLEEDLVEKQQTILKLEKQISDDHKTIKKLYETIQEHKNAKLMLEKEHESVITKKDQELEDLKSANTKLLVDLKCIEDKFIISLKEANKLSDEMERENGKVKSLISENSAVQQKFEKCKAEVIASELKMMELISNFQEVRENQDAVLKTQEKALTEKSLHIEDLQKEFSELKLGFSRELENEKLLSRSLQTKCAELQIQSHRQMNKLQELEEALQNERVALNENKEYCKTENTNKLKIAEICEKLEDSVISLKVITEEIPNVNEFYTNIFENAMDQKSDDNTMNVLNTIQFATNEVQATGKLIKHLFDTKLCLEKKIEEQKVTLEDYSKNCEQMEQLKDDVLKLKENEEKHKQQLKNLIKQKVSLKDSIQEIIETRKNLDSSLSTLQTKWNKIIMMHCNIFATDGSVCDELKHLRAQKKQLEDDLHKYNISHLMHLTLLNTVLWQNFLWTEKNVENTHLYSNINEEHSNISTNITSNLLNKNEIGEYLRKNKMLEEDLLQFERRMNEFSEEIKLFVVSLEADESKLLSEAEKKLRMQIQEIVEEKNEVASKLNALRIRNVKLEDNVQELTTKKNRMMEEMEDLKKDTKLLKEENMKLCKEQIELSKRPTRDDLDNQLKEAYNKYKMQLDDSKNKLTTLYNKQIAKLNSEQESCIREMESLQEKMKQQCIKQADEINTYKAHVSKMSSQLWTVGEKLLTEQQQKAELQKELNKLKARLESLELQMDQHHTISTVNHRTIKCEKGDSKEEVFHKVSVIKEKTMYERRCSIMQIVGGNAFNAEDEEGEVFDNIYLNDVKEGQSSFTANADRLSVLMMRNSLCKPHLKTSYPGELQFHPLSFTEEEIKTGTVHEEVFNDSLSQSLLPEQKVKKKDRTQTSYKKPGPPTPSKNGGRLSLQGNELKSPNCRILRERNKDRTTATPRALKNLFKRHDENAISTPKDRRKKLILPKCIRTSNR